MKNILDNIYNNYQKFTPSQKKLAKYIHDNSEKIVLLNSLQIARKVNVSEATVTRFIVSLGFSGFYEFKKEIARQVMKDFSTTKRLSDSAEDFEGEGNIFLEILKGDMKNIRDLPVKISDKLFMDAIDLLCAASSIYILGLRSSYSLAFYLAFTLRFFLKKVTLVKPGIGDLPEQVLDAQKNDVLVVVSFRRYTR